MNHDLPYIRPDYGFKKKSGYPIHPYLYSPASSSFMIFHPEDYSIAESNAFVKSKHDEFGFYFPGT